MFNVRNKTAITLFLATIGVVAVIASVFAIAIFSEIGLSILNFLNVVWGIFNSIFVAWIRDVISILIGGIASLFFDPTITNEMAPTFSNLANAVLIFGFAIAGLYTFTRFFTILFR